jgi:hypothetical protein
MPRRTVAIGFSLDIREEGREQSSAVLAALVTSFRAASVEPVRAMGGES